MLFIRLTESLEWTQGWPLPKSPGSWWQSNWFSQWRELMGPGNTRDRACRQARATWGLYGLLAHSVPLGVWSNTAESAGPGSAVAVAGQVLRVPFRTGPRTSWELCWLSSGLNDQLDRCAQMPAGRLTSQQARLSTCWSAASVTEWDWLVLLKVVEFCWNVIETRHLWHPCYIVSANRSPHVCLSYMVSLIAFSSLGSLPWESEWNTVHSHLPWRRVAKNIVTKDGRGKLKGEKWNWAAGVRVTRWAGTGSPGLVLGWALTIHVMPWARPFSSLGLHLLIYRMGKVGSALPARRIWGPRGEELVAVLKVSSTIMLI